MRQSFRHKARKPDDQTLSTKSKSGLVLTAKTAERGSDAAESCYFYVEIKFHADMSDTTMKVSNTSTTERESDRDICHFDVEI